MLLSQKSPSFEESHLFKDSIPSASPLPYISDRSPCHLTPSGTVTHPSTSQGKPTTPPHCRMESRHPSRAFPPPPTSHPANRGPGRRGLPASSPQRLWRVGFWTQCYYYLPEKPWENSLPSKPQSLISERGWQRVCGMLGRGSAGTR